MRLCRAHTVPGSIGGSAKAPHPPPPPTRVPNRMEKDVYLCRTRPGGSDSHPQSLFIKNRPNYPACRSYFGRQRAGDFDY